MTTNCAPNDNGRFSRFSCMMSGTYECGEWRFDCQIKFIIKVSMKLQCQTLGDVIACLPIT